MITTYFDLVFAIQLVVVQSILGDGGACLVHVLHECDIALRGDKTHFVQVRVPNRRQRLLSIVRYQKELTVRKEP